MKKAFRAIFLAVLGLGLGGCKDTMPTEVGSGKEVFGDPIGGLTAQLGQSTERAWADLANGPIPGFAGMK